MTPGTWASGEPEYPAREAKMPLVSTIPEGDPEAADYGRGGAAGWGCITWMVLLGALAVVALVFLGGGS